jgi:hypothetical protein
MAQAATLTEGVEVNHIGSELLQQRLKAWDFSRIGAN